MQYSEHQLADLSDTTCRKVIILKTGDELDEIRFVSKTKGKLTNIFLKKKYFSFDFHLLFNLNFMLLILPILLRFYKPHNYPVIHLISTKIVLI